MAVLNICSCSKLHPIPKLHNALPSSTQHSFSSVSPPNCTRPQLPGLLNQSQAPENPLICLGESIGLLSASLFFASDPALAFKGGGPYGAEVTRGQDLTRRGFSGKSFGQTIF